MLFRRIIARLFGYEVVWLIDFDGEVNLRLAKETPFGLAAWRTSRLVKVGQVFLIDGGKVTGPSSSFVVKWRKA